MLTRLISRNVHDIKEAGVLETSASFRSIFAKYISRVGMGALALDLSIASPQNLGTIVAITALPNASPARAHARASLFP